MASPDGTHYVFLRLGAAKDNDVQVNTIPLKAETISVSTTKTIPSFDVPFSGMFSGESRTVAFNMGMASKSISVTGVITDTTIIRRFNSMSPKNFDKSVDRPSSSSFSDPSALKPPIVNDTITIDMTKEEIAQLIHSNTDGTALQQMQNMNELIILIDSKVDSRYQYRNSDESKSLIPFTYAARGFNDTLDNEGATLALSDFPDSATDTGLNGFVQSFSCDFNAEEPMAISFQLEFIVAMTV
tara:strand:+ start:330 stop:1055 length:726 start_codon:yes stop_codon:yes gene_type:complete